MDFQQKQQLKNKEINQQIQDEKQIGNINNDWVNVDNEWSTDTHMRKVRISEKLDVNSPEALEATKALYIYTPSVITKEDLKKPSAEDKVRDAAKVADLRTKDLNQLTEWALSNAKVRGADPGFIKLVENLINLKTLGESIKNAPSLDAMSECRKQLELELSTLSPNIESYFTSHNKLIVFSEKGRLRLELCNILRNRISAGLMTEIRSKADYDGSERLFELENKESKKNHPMFTFESEHWVEQVKKRYNNELPNYDKLRKDNENLQIFEKKVAKDDETIVRRHLRVLFKNGTQGADEWNNDVLNAMTQYNESGSVKSLDKVVEKLFDEIIDFKFKPEMADVDYVIGHPDFFVDINRMVTIGGDLDSTNFKGVLPESVRRYLGKSKRTEKKFRKQFEMLSQLQSFYTKALSNNYGIAPAAIEKGQMDKVYANYFGQEEVETTKAELVTQSETLKSQIKDAADNSAEDNYTNAEKMQILQKDIANQDYYSDKYRNTYNAKEQRQEFNRVVGQAVLVVERDENGEPIEEDKEIALLNEKYIAAINEFDADKCAEALDEYADYFIDNAELLFKVGTDVEKVFDNFKAYQSCFALTFNMLSIQCKTKNPYLDFVKSDKMAEKVKDKYDVFNAINDMMVMQDAYIGFVLRQQGINKEKCIEVKPLQPNQEEQMQFEMMKQGYEETMKIARKLYDEYKKKPKLSREEFMKEFRKFNSQNAV